jgi:hypothetical protein
MAIAQILFEQGWIDPGAPSYCDHVDEFHALAKGRSVSEWCREADVSTEVAYDLATTRRTSSYRHSGWLGMGRRINGAGAVRALDALCALSGILVFPEVEFLFTLNEGSL